MASAEDLAGPLSRALFWWVYPFLRRAYEEIRCEAFCLESLPGMPNLEEPEPTIEAFRALVDEERLRSKPSLHRVVWRFWRKAFRPQIVICVLISLAFSVSPLLLRQVVRAMKGHLPLYFGYLGVVSMAAVGIMGGLLQQYSFHVMSHLGRLTWVAFVGCLFEKPARLDASTFNKHFSEGQVISLIGQDASMFPYLSPFFSLFMATPFNILFPGVVLFVFFREAFLVGLAVCFVVGFVSDRASHGYKLQVAKKLHIADSRIVLINEALQGIRSVKLCVWESSVESRVAEARARELRHLFFAHLWYALQQGLVAALPVLVAVATFVAHAALGRPFETETVIMAIGCFEQMSIGFLLLPNVQMQFKTLSMTVTRIGRVLLQPDTYVPTAVAGVPVGVRMHKACFTWDLAAPEPVLSDISAHVGSSELVAVVGRVASGKTSLASSVFGLLQRVRGDLVVGGRCALVPQNPQILNASVRDNVLFGLPYDAARYRNALQCCCLEPDLAQFSEGDLTEIGEKGITISGGQRARVALARAHFSDADVVVLDDPLSAMDAQVGQSVFRRCIQQEMQRKGKAVLLFTNQLHFCETADRVYVLDNGRIVQQGSFQELVASGGSFAELYASSANNDDEDNAGVAGDEVNIRSAGPSDDGMKKAAAEIGGDEAGCAANGVGSAQIKIAAAAAENQTASDGAGAEDRDKPKVDENSEAASDSKNQPTGLGTSPSRSVMVKETMMQGRIGISEFLRVARVGRSFCCGLTVVICCLLAPVFMFAANIFLSMWITVASESGSDPLEHKKQFAYYVSVGGLFAVCQCARVLAAAVYFTRISEKLHGRMVAAILRQAMVWYDTTPIGRVLNRFSQDVALLDLQLPRLFEFTVQHQGVVLVGVVGSVILVWPTIFFLLPLSWAVLGIFRQYGAVSLHLQRIMLVSTSPVMSQTSSFLTALDTIRAFGQEGFFLGAFQKSIADFNRTYYWIHVVDRFIMSVLISVCVPALTLLLGLGMLLLSRTDVISADLAALALALASGLAQRIPLCLWCTATTEKFFGGAQRVSEYAELRWEGRLADHCAWGSPFAPPQPREGFPKADARERNHSEGALVLEDVHLRYQPGLPLVLRGLSLKVDQGVKLGVCGRTGSGKSTLFLACFRMVEPERGRIFVDGHDAQSIPLPVLRSRLAIVPQDPLMFSGTIRSNLDVRGCHSDADLWEALRCASLEPIVSKLDGGLDAPVREKGANFSAGTVQLLCIARVFLERQRFVFLDECTASVDVETDATVQVAVRSAFAERAVICIAHRINTIIDYDLIACLDAGVLGECGSPAELLQKPKGFFSRLVDSTGERSAAELRIRAACKTQSVETASI